MKIISTQEVRDLIENKDKEYVLMDIREEDELNYGMIPTAKHIPLRDFQDALQMDDDEFKEKYGFEKPSNKILMIIYCRTGSRAVGATKMAQELGYNVVLYSGSVLEWSEIDQNVRMY